MRKYRPFEECRGVGHSFAFNRAEDYDIYDSREKSVRKLIDLVSKGGVLLLDVGPTADGRIPLIMVDRLFAIGDWLAINGESIKGAQKSPFGRTPWGRATTRDGILYLHVYDWPENDVLEIPGLISPISRATMLGDRSEERELDIDSSGAWQKVDLSGLHPFEHATVIRCEFDSAMEIDESIRANDEGVFRLEASAATLDGPAIRIEHFPGPDGTSVPSIGYWSDPAATASWTVRAAPGRYRLHVDHALRKGHEGGVADLVVSGDSRRIAFREPTGDSWSAFSILDAGIIELPASDKPISITMRPVELPGEAMVNLRSITLEPVE